jgi:hypothetical protein
MLILDLLKKLYKVPVKKVISINVEELCTFSPFCTVYKSSFFAVFSTHSDSALNSAFNVFIGKNIFWFKKNKNELYKCVLEFNFEYIYGSGLSIF